MRRLYTVPFAMALGLLPFGFASGSAQAAVAAGLGAIQQQAAANSGVTLVGGGCYGGYCGGYGYRPYYGGYGYGYRPYYGGYGYGYRPYYRGYGYGYYKPYYGSYYGGYYGGSYFGGYGCNY